MAFAGHPTVSGIISTGAFESDQLYHFSQEQTYLFGFYQLFYDFPDSITASIIYKQNTTVPMDFFLMDQILYLCPETFWM